MTELYRKYERSAGVTTDSRSIPAGSIFFALRGGNFDGNRFAAEALGKGAAYAVVDDPAVMDSDRMILVEDVLSTLQHLATYHRRVLGIPILAITGTNGKTTTKELTARVLSKRYRVAATEGNLNNHIGVPLTLLSFGEGVEFGIVEMGASAVGEIDMLCSIAQPDYGMITNIGVAHLEGFGSPEGVKKGKGELYNYLATHHGVAFYLSEDPVLTEMVSAYDQLLSKPYDTSGVAGIKSKLTGKYNLYNIAAASAVGEYFGVVRKEIVESIESYEPSNQRSQKIETGLNTVILDCYNANPSSMRTAISDFAAIEDNREKTVIAGDMLEIGSYSADEHLDILGLLRGSSIDRILLVGKDFSAAAEGTGLTTFPDVEQLEEFLKTHPLRDNIILLKGSRGIKLEKIIPSI